MPQKLSQASLSELTGAQTSVDSVCLDRAGAEAGVDSACLDHAVGAKTELLLPKEGDLAFEEGCATVKAGRTTFRARFGPRRSIPV